MAKTHVIQSSFLSGVLDPRAAARVETDAYNSGLFTGRNIVPIHLGGVRRRGGLPRVATLPGIIERIESSLTNPSPEGGTAANGNDGDDTTLLTTTGTVGTTDPFVVAHYDLGSPMTIRFADVLNMFSSGGSSTQFRIQYSDDDIAWTQFDSAFEIVDATPRGYRRGESAVTARYWRLAKIGGTDMGAVTISIGEFNLWVDSGDVSESRLIPFEVSADRRFMVVLTDRSATIFQGRTLVAQVPTPYTTEDLAGIDAATNAETMVLVHEDYAPRFLLLEGDEFNFQCEAIDFDAIPSTDYADALSPVPVSEVQVITFASGWVQGNTFQVELEGAKSAAITYAGDATADEQATTAANIAREVQKLFTVEGFSGVSCARTGTREYTVTFAEGSAGTYDLMNVIPLSSSAAATVARSAAGTARTEPVWSATRGYPRTVTFYEGRLWFGGVRSLQQSLFASEVNNILNFEPGEGLPDDPIFVTIATQSLNATQGLYAGRSLQVFTTGGEFRFAKPQGTPIVPGDAPTEQTKYGAKKIRPVNIDGATIYVQRNGKSIRDFRFDYEEDAYSSLGVSSLAPHLIESAVDIAAYNGSTVDEIGLVFVVNAVGTAAVFNSRKEAQIQAWTEWTTEGLFRAVGVVLQDIYFTTMRDIDGVDVLFLEIVDDSYYTDCSIQQTFSAATVITGLAHLEGEEVRVRADEFVLESQTVAGGEITIERASDEVEVGLNFDTEITPMPLNTLTPGTAAPNSMRKRRVVKVRAKVRNTLGLRLNGRILPDTHIATFDQPPEPFTGNLPLEETTNWDEREDKFITFSQVDPLPLELLGLDVHLETNE